PEIHFSQSSSPLPQSLDNQRQGSVIPKILLPIYRTLSNAYSISRIQRTERLNQELRSTHLTNSTPHLPTRYSLTHLQNKRIDQYPIDFWTLQNKKPIQVGRLKSNSPMYEAQSWTDSY